MFGFLKKASTQVALAGANDCIKNAMLYVESNPQDSESVAMMSHMAVKFALNNFGIELTEEFLEEAHNPNFHRVAYEMRKRAQEYPKNSSEWAAGQITQAIFSILGVEPESPMRKMLVAQTKELWSGRL